MGTLDQSNNCGCSFTCSTTCTTDNTTTSCSVGNTCNSCPSVYCSVCDTPTSTNVSSGYCCNITPETIEKAPEPAPAPKPAAQCGPTKDSGFCCGGNSITQTAAWRRRVLGR